MGVTIINLVRYGVVTDAPNPKIAGDWFKLTADGNGLHRQIKGTDFERQSHSPNV
jgi:hypothetical protein